MLLASSIPAVPQDKPAEASFRLQFTFRQTDQGRLVSKRDYSFLVSDKNRGRINTGARIPYQPESARDNQVHMASVGVLIECSVQDVAPAQPPRPTGFPPVIHMMQSRITGSIPTGKPALLTTLDDPATGHRLEVEVIANRM